MRTIEIIRKLASPALIGGLGALLSLGIAASAWGGECVQDEPGATTVMTSGGSTSCATVNGQFGCRVRFNGSAIGGCEVYDDDENLLYSVVATFNNDDGLSWSIEDDTSAVPLAAKVNTVIVRAPDVTPGNACRYIYANEATTGSGQGWEVEEGFIADVTDAYFCTDGETDDTPPPRCEDISELDGVSIDCSTVPAGEPRILFSATPDSPTWNTLGCTCNVPLGLQTCDEYAEDGDENKCTGDEKLKALPVTIELGNDGTWICRTIGGERKCWRR